jgi:hypothetical protein
VPELPLYMAQAKLLGRPCHILFPGRHGST